MSRPAAPRHPVSPSRPALAAFTLIELLLSMTILSVLMLIVTNVISVVQKTWVRANSRVSEFREARSAFDTIARNLSQATLNVYWQSVDPLGAATQTFQKTGSTPNSVLANAYVRQSELQFVTGPATKILGAAANGADNPGHAVFFQAPLGITRLVAGGGTVNTENMVNLLCGRGYFVSWGDDLAFRPAFLDVVSTVRARKRFRLMEYSPTSEKNRIYDAGLRPIVDPTNPNKNFSKQWFQLDLVAGGGQAVAGQTAADRAIVRPVADNVLCLVICPELEVKARDPNGSALPPNSIAPNYEYDSLLKVNPGATPANFTIQGTQHLLPPLIKITMIVVDNAAGERFAEDDSLRQNVAGLLAPKFTDATNHDNPGSSYHQDLAEIESFFVQQRLNYRIFTTTVIMKQARWST